MAFNGTIVSHDISLHTGLVLADGSAQAISFTEGDVFNWRGTSSLFGQRVSFEVVQTPTGYAAIHMVPLQEERRRLIKPGDWMAALVAPLLVAGATYCASYFFLLPLAFAYIPVVNFISFVMLILVASSPQSAKPRPAEISLMLLAFCGGALSVFVGILITRTRFRSEGVVVFLFSILIMQGIMVKKFLPEIFDFDTWRMFLEFSDLLR
jgi:uncharacterized membrane protein YsdA (DUF1294 family)